MNRRWRNFPGRIRQRRFDPPWTTAPVPRFLTQSTRRWVALRRGLVRPRPWFEPPGPQVLPPPLIDASGARPRWYPLPRRGSFRAVPVVPPVVAAVPLAFVDQAGPRSRAAVLRRGTFQPLPQPVVTPPVFIRRTRLSATVRRGGFLPLPLVFATAPSSRRARPTLAITPRRGAFQFVPVVAAPVAPAVVPTWRPARRISGLLSRRGGYLAVPNALPQTGAPRGRSRPASVLARRGTFQAVPPATVVTPAVAVPAFRSQARPHLANLRRGHAFFTPPTVPVVAAYTPDFHSQPAVARRAWQVLRRGVFNLVPPAPVAPAAYVPTFRSQRLRPWARPSQGTYLASVLLPPAGPAPLTPSTQRQTRRPQVPLRRGSFAAPPWPQQAAPAAPDIVLRASRAPVRALAVRRGQFQALPASQIAPTKAARQARVRLPRSAHGGMWTVPPTVQPPIPQICSSRRPAAPVRSGTFAFTPFVVRPSLPDAIRQSGQPGPLKVRGGKIFPTPFTQPPPGPGPLVLGIRRQSRRPALPTRGGRFATPPWPPIQFTLVPWPPSADAPYVRAPLAVADRPHVAAPLAVADPPILR